MYFFVFLRGVSFLELFHLGPPSFAKGGLFPKSEGPFQKLRVQAVRGARALLLLLMIIPTVRKYPLAACKLQVSSNKASLAPSSDRADSLFPEMRLLM